MLKLEAELQRPAKREAGELKFSYGGQAVIEGVMMRGAHSMAVAARDPKGQIVVHEQPLSARLYRGRIARTPFLRGLIGLWDALGLGIRALMWSADIALDEEEDVSFSGPIGWATIAVSLIIGVGIFFLLPTATATGIGNLLGLSTAGAEIVVDEQGNDNHRRGAEQQYPRLRGAANWPGRFPYQPHRRRRAAVDSGGVYLVRGADGRRQANLRLSRGGAQDNQRLRGR